MALAGRSIVVTRPKRQAAELASLIECAGGRVVQFPVITIEPVGGRALDMVLGQLAGYDMAVFISRNAVEQGFACVRRINEWPSHLRVAAIGAGTRRALEAEGMANVIAPEGQADTDALLTCPEFELVDGKRILVFRGVDGREQLAATLRSRGAHVDYAECYRRNRAKSDPKTFIEAHAAGALDAITISSAEGLANLNALLGKDGEDLLHGTPLFVPHPRVADAAKALGIERVVVAGPSNEDVLAALVAYFAHSG